MKTAKILYFAVCFTVMCIFFYFFCNTRNSLDPISNTANSWSGYQSLTVYFDSHGKGMDINKCAIYPNISNYSYINTSNWQSTRNFKIFLYSAFLDSRLKYQEKLLPYVRILGMTEGVNTDKLYCRLWYSNRSDMIVKAEQNEIWVDKWDLAKPSQFYRPYLFSCPVPNDSNHLPNAVSIVAQPCSNLYNKLDIQSPPHQQAKEDFAVCLKAIDNDEDISLRFLEWAELQFLLGAHQIAVYVYRVHPNLAKVLNYYRNIGKLSIKYHTLPGRDPNDPSKRSEFLKKNIWQKRRHEIVQYNDCFYQHINTHKFVVILDMDEAIMPMMHTNWNDLLEHVFEDHTDALQKYSSLSVTNVYFFDKFGEYTKDADIPSYMHMLRHIYRSSNFSSPGFAVKSFQATNNTLSVFNHYTLTPLYHDLRRNALVGRHLAQLHHYRGTCPPLMEKECETTYMKYYEKDTVMWKFKDSLIQNVKKIAEELELIDYDIVE